jgi:hypothetical protein
VELRRRESWPRILPKCPTSTFAFRDLLHAANLRHGTDGFTSPPKEGVLRICSPLKIRRLRPGLNPRTWPTFLDRSNSGILCLDLFVLRVSFFRCTKRYSDELVPKSVCVRNEMKLRVHRKTVEGVEKTTKLQWNSLLHATTLSCASNPINHEIRLNNISVRFRRTPLLDLCVDGRIILKLILKKQDGIASTEFLWFRVRTSGGLLWER